MIIFKLYLASIKYIMFINKIFMSFYTPQKIPWWFSCMNILNILLFTDNSSVLVSQVASTDSIYDQYHVFYFIYSLMLYSNITIIFYSTYIQIDKI